MKNDNNLDQSELTKEILLGFHTQFAENQRSREQLFLKIVGFLGVVIFGYAYVYENLWYDLDKFSLVAFSCEIILAFGAFTVITIGYNFRRDQAVNAKIRLSCDILGDNKIFPQKYDPSYSLRGRRLNWLPDFLQVFYLIFPVFQIILITSYILKVISDLLPKEITYYFHATILISIIAIGLTLVLPFLYYSKLKKSINIADKQ